MEDKHKTFEVISVFFANCYWNQLYDQAKGYLYDEKFDTMELSYSNVAEHFNRAFSTINMRKKEDTYLVILNSLIRQYNFSFERNYSYKGFINKIINFILPALEYDDNVEFDIKDKLIRSILLKCFKKPCPMKILNSRYLTETL